MIFIGSLLSSVKRNNHCSKTILSERLKEVLVSFYQIKAWAELGKISWELKLLMIEYTKIYKIL